MSTNVLAALNQQIVSEIESMTGFWRDAAAAATAEAAPQPQKRKRSRRQRSKTPPPVANT
jgi:hypothetical protein